jgi:hypothetical protein
MHYGLVRRCERNLGIDNRRARRVHDRSGDAALKLTGLAMHRQTKNPTKEKDKDKPQSCGDET